MSRKEIEKGDKIKCISNHFTYTSQEKTRKLLEVGKEYTFDRAHIGDWHTDIYLIEFENIVFNSVWFDIDIYRGKLTKTPSEQKCERCRGYGIISGKTDWFFGQTYDETCPACEGTGIQPEYDGEVIPLEFENTEPPFKLTKESKERISQSKPSDTEEFVKRVKFSILLEKSSEGWGCPKCNKELLFDDLKVEEAEYCEDNKYFCPECGEDLTDIGERFDIDNETYLAEALDRLEQREVENRQKQSRLNGYEVITDKLTKRRDELSADLAKRDEAIRFLINEAKSKYQIIYSTNFETKLTEILGSETFDKIIKDSTNEKD